MEERGSKFNIAAVEKAVKRESLEYKFKKTGELKYLVLAFGKGWSDPPDWALEEAIKYHNEYERFFDPKTNKPLGKYGGVDGELLDRIAGRFIKLRRERRSDQVLRTAVRQEMGDEFDESTYRRIQRIWSRDSGKHQGLKTWNRWIDRALVRENFERALRDIPLDRCDVCGARVQENALPEFMLEVRLDHDNEKDDAVRSFSACSAACVAEAAAQFKC